MSEMEGWSGKAIPVCTGMKRYEAIGQVLRDDGQVPASEESDLMDQFYELRCYEWINGQMYLIVAEEFDTEGFVKGTKNADGDIDFTILWYNGGGSRNEVLEQAIKQANTEGED